MTTGRVARPFYSSSAQIGFLHRIFITVNVLCLSRERRSIAIGLISSARSSVRYDCARDRYVGVRNPF